MLVYKAARWYVWKQLQYHLFMHEMGQH